MKKCRIYNDTLTWVMEVDNHTIAFSGSYNAEYFKELYTSFGYDVEFDADYYKTKEQ